MAGAVITAPMILVDPGSGAKRMVPIKNAEIINQGDLCRVDINGQAVVASKTAAAVTRALWIAFFPDENGMATSRTGKSDLSVKTGLCKKARLKNATSTLVPSLNKGLSVFLGDVPTASQSNYTCALSITATEPVGQVGSVEEDGVTLNIDLSSMQSQLLVPTSNISATTVYG